MNAVAHKIKFESVDGYAIPLKGVDISGNLSSVFANIKLAQTYKNESNKNIEAVYTFAIPLGAIIMNMSVALDGRQLSGRVLEKRLAEEKYEDAITDGKSACMLEMVEPGLYTMNVGNIMPGEIAVICLEYSEPLKFDHGYLRFRIPTTLAPRYGNPLASGFSEHQIPEHDHDSRYGFSLHLDVNGMLSQSKISCVSHSFDVRREGESAIISSTSKDIPMDRDIVLMFDGTEASSGAMYCKDGNGYAVMASFTPVFSENGKRAARSIKAVIDCSGSMSGTSISQAKKALIALINGLQEHDQFNITAFGSSYKILFDAMSPVDREKKSIAVRFVEGLGDMGGTELEKALIATYEIPSKKDIEHDVLLVTDGQIFGAEGVIHNARSSAHRFFTVGVGSAVSEMVVRGLAEATGGACELVTPKEDMSIRINAHFSKIYNPRSSSVSVDFGGDVVRGNVGLVKSVFSGETVHFAAYMQKAPKKECVLTVGLEDGGVMSFRVKPSKIGEKSGGALFGVLPRVCAHLEMFSLEDSDAKQLAVKYGLMSKHTNYIFVDDCTDADLASEAPELRKVPLQIASGWGGLQSAKAPSYQGMLSSASGSPVYSCVASNSLRSMDSFGGMGSVSNRIDCDITPRLGIGPGYWDRDFGDKRAPGILDGIFALNNRAFKESSPSEFLGNMSGMTKNQIESVTLMSAALYGLPSKACDKIRAICASLGISERDAILSLINILVGLHGSQSERLRLRTLVMSVKRLLVIDYGKALASEFTLLKDDSWD